MDRKDKDSAAIAMPSVDRVGPSDSEVLDLGVAIRALKRRRRMVVLVAAAVFAAGMLLSIMQRPSYESTARLLISSSKGPGLLSMASAAVPMDIQKMLGGSSVETEAQMLSDDQLLQDAYLRLSTGERKTAFGEAHETTYCKRRKLLERAVKVVPKRGTDVLEIRVRSHSPHGSADLANAIVQTYFDKGFDQSSRSIRKAREFAQSKMQVLSKQLSQANKEMADFKRASHLVAPDAQMDKFAEYMMNLQTDLDKASTEQSAGRRQIRELEQQIAKENPNVVSGDIIKQNPRFAASAETIDQLYSKRAEMLQEYKPQSRDIQSLDAQIKQEETRLEQTSKTIIDSLMHSRNPIRDTLVTSYASTMAQQAATDASVGVLKRRMDEQNKAADSLPEEERQLLELQGKVDLLTRAYGLVSDQYYSLLLSEQQNTPKAQIIANAIPETEPVTRGLAGSAAMFLVLGTLLGLVMAIATECLDGRVREPKQAERASGYFASTTIPIAAKESSPLITRAGPHSNMLESFRVLRNNIYFAALERRLRILAVTSPSCGDGKTVTCANLAVAIAMDGKTVVVVDCNMDHPEIRTLIRKSYDFGLTNVLSGGCDLDRAIVQGDQDNLSLVPSGPLVLNFPELVNSERGRKVFAQLAERFDYVLLDCPPLSNLGDVQVISTVADGALLVARLEKTLASDLSAASQSLSHIGIPVVGFVVNGVADQANRDAHVRGGGLDDDLKTGRGKTVQPRS